jgi:AcrR family transcriptional regulator
MLRPMAADTPVRARRLSRAARAEEILAAAGAVLSRQGFLPIPYEQVAREAGASKALVYDYFTTQARLCDALARRLLAPLADRLEPAGADFEAWAGDAAALYFDQVADSGAALHLLFDDAFLAGARERATLARRDALWRRVLRAARAYVRLPPAEQVAAMAIVLSIPEELGRLAHRGEMERPRARALCRRLVISALRGLRDDGAAQLSD